MAPSRGNVSKAKHKPSKNPSKAAASKSNTSTAGTAASATKSLNFYQSLLTVFRNAIPSTFDADLAIRLQEIKKHLYQRNFEQAFGRQELLEAYAIRWSPSRALAYVGIFEEVFRFINKATAVHNEAPNDDDVDASSTTDPDAQTTPSSDNDAITVLGLGGGSGAELAALAGLLKTQDDIQKVKFHAVDSASWATCLQALHRGLTTAPPLSAYASASARAANVALVSADRLQYAFAQLNVLASETMPELRGLIREADVVTLMFTLNELFKVSPQDAILLLQVVTAEARIGSVLVVVDSPGSYAEFSVGREGDKKKYPMSFWLEYGLIHTGATSGNEEREPKRSDHSGWEKVIDENARWFRLPDGLKYPIDLEDMRYQTHVYKRL